MKIFLKLLPYLLIIVLGLGIYFGFRYMSNEIASVESENASLIVEKNELENRLTSIAEMNNITVEQLETLIHNEHESQEYIANVSNKVDNLNLNNDIDEILVKINNYEKCMAENSLKPEVKCDLEIE